MNPANNSLNRTYFIGGPPRVGKSILAYKLARKLSGHVVSTDAIRSAAKKACQDKDGDLFAINQMGDLSDVEWKQLHLEEPGKVVEYQNKESRAFWTSIESFCSSFCEDEEIHIVEGVALLPELVDSMKHKPEYIIFVGNTNEAHLTSMKKYAEEFPELDWMSAMGYDDERFAGMAKFVNLMSHYFKNEAEKYGFQYVEINDNSFGESIDGIVEQFIK